MVKKANVFCPTLFMKHSRASYFGIYVQIIILFKVLVHQRHRKRGYKLPQREVGLDDGIFLHKHFTH